MTRLHTTSERRSHLGSLLSLSNTDGAVPHHEEELTRVFSIPEHCYGDDTAMDIPRVPLHIPRTRASVVRDRSTTCFGDHRSSHLGLSSGARHAINAFIGRQVTRAPRKATSLSAMQPVNNQVSACRRQWPGSSALAGGVEQGRRSRRWQPVSTPATVIDNVGQLPRQLRRLHLLVSPPCCLSTFHHSSCRRARFGIRTCGHCTTRQCR